MRVAILFREGTQHTMQLAGAFVTHGLSSRQAMDTVNLLATKDIVIELRGPLKELKATFTRYGFDVEEVNEEAEAKRA